MHKPDFLSFEEAASLGVWRATIGSCSLCRDEAAFTIARYPVQLGPHDARVWRKFSLRNYRRPSGQIVSRDFIMCDIQLTRPSLGQDAASSLHAAANCELVQSRGAERWFDYNQPDCVEQIKVIGLPITHIVDCIDTEESGLFCSKILSLPPLFLQAVITTQSRSRFPSHSGNPDPRRGQLLPLLSGIPCLAKNSSSLAWRSSLPILRWKDSLKNGI
jgi:hypothetical protein